MHKIIVLDNGEGLRVSLSNFGARIIEINYQSSDGLFIPMTLGPTAPQAIEADNFFMGASCGPVCNRIRNATYQLNSQIFSIPKNLKQHCLHGGTKGLSSRFWHIDTLSKHALTMRCQVDHLEDGFGGNRSFTANFELNKHTLNIEYQAFTDASTPINLTNHVYFNLGEANILNLECKIAAKQFIERDSEGIPNGKITDTSSMGFSVSQWRPISDLVSGNLYPQIIHEKGLDHCFILNKSQNQAASLRSKRNAVQLDITSNQPAMQVYTGRFLSGEYQPYQGMCFESQGYTDAVNHAHFPSIIISPEHPYQHKIGLCFSHY